MGYVHIDDVAHCHILLYENEASHGRYLCSSTTMDNDDLVALLAIRYPGLPIPKRFSFFFFVEDIDFFGRDILSNISSID